MSRRLDAILALARPCGTLADVCCDHARLAIEAVARGLAERAIAIDRAAGPLAVAAANRASVGMGDRLELRLGDGLSPLAPGEGDVLVIAGVGAQLAVRLLDTGHATLAGFQQAIIQPNQQPEFVRAWARRAGWHLDAETVVFEDGRFFPVLAFQPGQGPDPAYEQAGFTPEEWQLIGPRLVGQPGARAYFEERLAWHAGKAGRQPGAADMADLWRRALRLPG